ncbi:MAG: type VI secretion system membrane subunit TssM [Pseudomonadota bacterium]
MGVLKAFFGFLFSRLLWTIIGLVILSLLIGFFGHLLKFGDTAPLESDLSRTIAVGVIWILWLLRLLWKQIRAARANRMFVAELAAAPPEEPGAPGAENVAEVNAKFAEIMDQMKRSKLGGRKFLRDMPWYLIIGPPGTGKTTALRQSGLHFPIDLSDDLKGVGGTRNCDWFFTEEAVLVDTAGRYVQQQSDAEVDAAEWKGFLELLTKHRGRRALNGVILTLSVQELTGSEASIREHGREIRKRLIELQDELGMQLPVYLMITKADLMAGFEPFFGDLSNRDREQVWGATLPTDARVDGTTIDRETRALQANLETRLVSRMASPMPLDDRGAAFRFPSQLEQLSGPIKQLIDAVFGESRYEDSPWLRGFYLTSATQEGSPIDQMVTGMSRSLGLPPSAPKRRAQGEKRSFFLRNLLTEVIFKEAGLGTFDPRAEDRRRWVFRGTMAAATLATIIAAVMFTFSYMRYSGALADQERQLTTLSARLANVAARQAPTDPLDLDLALDAATETANATSPVQTGVLTLAGPTAEPELEKTQTLAYERTLRNILEPRMVATLEATMWRHSRDPEFLLGALKTYQMMTGLAAYDAEFIGEWWQTDLPEFAPIDVLPTQSALDHQLAAISRMSNEENRISADPALVNAALESICTIPLAIRAYRSLMREPDIAGLGEWIPAEHTGPNGTRVLTRLSEKTLRVGLPGAFTYDGFHKTVLPAIPEVAAQAILDRAVFEGGCSESSQTTTALLEADILKLYYDDFVAQWDSFLRDIRLAPINDLNTARVNLKDLSSDDSALKRLLLEVVRQTHLTRVETADSGGGAASSGLIKLATKKLGKVGKLAKKGAKIAGSGGGGAAPALPGAPVADHFKPLRNTVEEVEGQAPLLGDTVVALTALYNELQTVTSGSNPQAELLARGGLPLLTGAIADQAQFLPSPINDWVRGIAGDTIEFTRDAIVAGLSARWRADVMPFCVSATRGRYPFDPGSSIDVNTADFARLFGPGGLVDGFTESHLAPYIDTTTTPWSWRGDLGLDANLLVPFQNARSMRQALFPGGAGPVMSFTLEPRDLSVNASRVILNLDGQALSYFNAAARPMPMTWPGPDGTNMITMSFAPVDGSTEVITSQTGAWAFLRLIRSGRLAATDLPEVFRLSLAAGGYNAQFNLRANSVDNPFDLQMFAGFTCPTGF